MAARHLAKRLMFNASASAAAVAALLGGGPARAQTAFEATPNVAFGAVQFSNATPTDSNTTLFSPTAVIDWTPNDITGTGTINFMPAGNVMLFQAGSVVTQFTVLNRILPANAARPVALNGTVRSRVPQFGGPIVTQVPGGAVWFYAPGGIVLGSTAVIDVGALLLTSAAPLVDGNGGFINPATGTAVFQAANPASFVTVQQGASITMPSQNSYFAIFAPSVTMNGAANINGSAAYVAAETGSLTINQGLFDIFVSQGTDATASGGVALQHNGTTTGPASTGAGDPHRIYMVAVPKNDAITMLIGGGSDLGFAVAGAADVVGNKIVLSAGYDVQESGGTLTFGQTAPDGTSVSAIYTAGSVTSSLDARSIGQLAFRNSSGAARNFAGAVDVRAVSALEISATGAGSQTSFADSLFASATNIGLQGGDTGAGGDVIIRAANGAQINVASNADLAADGIGAPNFDTPTGTGDGIGGTVLVSAENGGQITFQSSLTATADGVGAIHYDIANSVPPGVNGGAGTGGSVTLQTIGNSSSISIGDDLLLNAQGLGGDGGVITGSGLNGGNGTGGSVIMQTLGGNGQIAANNFAAINASGIGAAGVASGSATGGTAVVVSNGAGSAITFTGLDSIDASATTGSSEAGAAGVVTGGTARIEAIAGSITIPGSSTANASATGGIANDATGSNAIGGTALIGSGGGALLLGGSAIADARAIGGNGASGGGNAIGGSASIVTNGIASTGSATIAGGAQALARATGGAGGNLVAPGGNATGGVAQVLAQNGVLQVNGTEASPFDNSQQAIALDASATGGQGAVGGNAVGGIATLASRNSQSGAAQITGGNVQLGAFARGGLSSGAANGAGATGGAGTGGIVTITGAAGNGSISLGNVVASASGTGGGAGPAIILGSVIVGGGAGGVGTGGSVLAGMVSGTATSATAATASFGNLQIFADGFGGTGGANGTGGAGGAGGAGQGGSTALVAQGGPVTLGNYAGVARGLGGAGGGGSTQGSGGSAIGGTASLSAVRRSNTPGTASAINAATLLLLTSPAGGAGSPAGSTSTAGAVNVIVDGGVINAATLQALNLNGLPTAAAPASALNVRNGAIVLTGALLLDTAGDVIVTVDNGSVDAATALLRGRNFIGDAALPAAPSPGAITANTVTLTSQQDIIASANFASANPLILDAAGLLRVGALASPGNVSALAVGSVTTGNITSGANALVQSDNGAIAVGVVTAALDADLYANGGNTSFTSVTADAIDIDGAGNVTGGALDSRDGISVLSPGTITIGNVSAGITNPSTTPGADYSIGIGALGNVVLGNAAARGGIGIGSQNGGITGGTITAETSALLLADQAITLGGVAAGSGAGDYVYIADSSMVALGGPLGIFNPAPILAANPVQTASSITINGPVSGGQIRIAAGTSLTLAGAVTATGTAQLIASGLASFGGLVRAPIINLTSGDLAISASGGLGDAQTTQLAIINSSGNPMILGGAAGAASAYQIDGAEMARLRGQAIRLQGTATGNRNIELRSFTLAGSGGATPNLIGANGSLTLGSAAFPGPITVTGNALINNMPLTNSVTINATTLTIFSESGSLILDGNSPGGTLNINAASLLAADAALRSQIAANPSFIGRDAALGVSTNSGLPVLQAQQINFAVPGSILIQNTGQLRSFGGLSSYVGGVAFLASAAVPAPPRDVVIYGSLLNPTTQLTTATNGVRDLIFPIRPTSGYTANSAINGCLLNVVRCGAFAPSDSIGTNIITQGYDVGSGSGSGQATASGNASDPNPETGSDEEDSNEVLPPKAGSQSPIQPPITIIDERPLLAEPLIDEPVTGTGNPALIDGGTL